MFAFINIAYFSYNLIDNLVILIIEISTISIFSLVSLIESVILEKDIKMEGRNINQYILKVLVNEKQIDIDVSVDAYYEKEVGDFVLIDYNKGCLGFCYYQYSTQN